MSFLDAIVQWLRANLGPGLEAIFKSLGKVRWFAVGIVTVVVSFLEVGINVFLHLTEQFKDAATYVFVQMVAFVSGANTASGVVGSAAGLANCILPISECFTAGAALLGLWLTLMGLRLLLFIYRSIPFKAT